MFRMRVQSIRSLLWLGNLVVILGILAILANIIQQHRKKTLTDWMDIREIQRRANAKGTIEPTERANQLKDWPEYSALWELNVTGKEPPPPVDVTENRAETVVQPMKPITDVLEVVMCVAVGHRDADAGYQGFAQIHYLEDGDRAVATPGPVIPTRSGVSAAGPAADPGKRSEPRVSDRFVGAGDELRPPYDAAPFFGKVVAIDSDGVVFKWGEEEIVVPTPKMQKEDIDGLAIMAGVDEHGNPIPGVKVEPKTPDPKERDSRRTGEHSWFIGTDEVDRVAASWEALAEEVVVRNQYVKGDDGTSGRLRLVIDRLPEDSLAYQRGFRAGDILRNINGEEIQSKSTVVQYMKRNPSKGNYRIEIERLGAVITKTFTVAN